MANGEHPERAADDASEPAADEKGVPVRIDWHLPDGLPVHWINHLVIQRENDDFFLTFFALHPPVLVGGLEEQRAQLEQLGQVKANAMARIIVPASSMRQFITVLNRQWERFQESGDRNEGEA